MATNIPFRLPPAGYALAAHVQANLDSLANAVDNLTLTGDITLSGAGTGLILTTPNGLHTYRLAIDNNGVVTSEQLT